jgi:hypothetical protein
MHEKVYTTLIVEVVQIKLLIVDHEVAGWIKPM